MPEDGAVGLERGHGDATLDHAFDPKSAHRRPSRWSWPLISKSRICDDALEEHSFK